eukprot:scaffold272195_cov41-Prasinocladus_malaysianus.AAC.1
MQKQHRKILAALLPPVSHRLLCLFQAQEQTPVAIRRPSPPETMTRLTGWSDESTSKGLELAGGQNKAEVSVFSHGEADDEEGLVRPFQVANTELRLCQTITTELFHQSQSSYLMSNGIQ